MPNQVLSSVENNFTKGLITEFTGLNFPENAATDCDNVTFTIVGDVLRREGIDYETNGSLFAVDRTNKALSDYKWNNAGGDGLTQVVVEQIGGTLYFYKSSAATVLSPLSKQRLVSTVDISQFVATGGVFDASQECQYSDGNGYLFVYQPTIDPFYCTYTSGVIAANLITIQIRDFIGVPEIGVADNFRPLTLSDDHFYNLINQGWVSGSPWSALSTTSVTIGTGAKTFIVATGLTITANQNVTVTYPSVGQRIARMTGTVTSYTSGTGSLVLSITSKQGAGTFADWKIVPVSTGYITTWFSAIGNYPSNADQWWTFKNTSQVFDPATTQANVSLGTGPAPKGSNILSAFNQDRAGASAIGSITSVTTTVRPRTGCWYQGRVWYTGVDAQQVATGDAPYSTWTENIYFSQIVTGTTDFGQCYQTNDPTSEILFDLLPTDGGVITIQGSGSIYKLFPLQNALLVFAANGVWYITGSAGIGFSANDYTIVKLSAVRSISSTSFVDVNGLPMFWNEEGIYSVEGAKQGTGLLNSPLHVNPLEVQPITVGTILSFFNNIPLQSKKYVRGDYDPIEYTIQWVYRSTNETTVTSRYEFDSILNYNNYNKAFFPYSVTGTPHIHGVRYVAGPGGSTSPDPVFKYFSSQLVSGTYSFTFADEHDTAYVDWKTFDTVGTNYDSFFVTGYKLHGQGQRRFQLSYLYTFSRADTPTSYKIQGLWDYANTGNSGRWSVAQLVNNWSPNFGMIFRRHKIRGQGLVLQIKVSSLDGQPFDLMGWSAFESQNAGV